jgi:hypothetical protein
MRVRECVNEFMGSLGTCFKSRRSTARMKQLLAAQRRAWRPRVPAARRGGAGRGQRGLHGRREGELRATWCGKGGAGQLATRESGRRAAGEHRREIEEEGLEVDDEDLVGIFQKCQDSTVK